VLQEIFHLRNVRELDITGNELSEMPGSLQAFENLRVLRWRGNKTKRIHDDVGGVLDEQSC
jgi:Leucine-rich repeat (LRR) protein